MKQYVVDAFTDKVFGGNPAAICVMDHWLPEQLMMNITIENNLSETAFTVKEGEKYKLRWFTPGGEIDLCGHATLACAYVIMNYYDQERTEVIFTTLSGDLTVKRLGDLYEMDFPPYDLKPAEVTAEMSEAMGAVPKEAYMGRDLLCVFDDEETFRSLNPDMEKEKRLEGLLLQVMVALNRLAATLPRIRPLAEAVCCTAVWRMTGSNSAEKRPSIPSLILQSIRTSRYYFLRISRNRKMNPVS